MISLKVDVVANLYSAHASSIFLSNASCIPSTLQITCVEFLAPYFFVNLLEFLSQKLLELSKQDLLFFLDDVVDLVEDVAFEGGVGAVAGRRR